MSIINEMEEAYDDDISHSFVKRNCDEKDYNEFSSAIYKVVQKFIDKDQYIDNIDDIITEGYKQIYDVKEIQIYYDPIQIPRVYCWVDVIDKKRFFVEKNKFHTLFCKNPIESHPEYIKFILEVKNIIIPDYLITKKEPIYL